MINIYYINTRRTKSGTPYPSVYKDPEQHWKMPRTLKDPSIWNWFFLQQKLAMVCRVDRILKYTIQIILKRTKRIQNSLLFLPQQRGSWWNIFPTPRLNGTREKLRSSFGLNMLKLLQIQKNLNSCALNWFLISTQQSKWHCTKSEVFH